MQIIPENTAITNGVSKSALEVEQLAFPGCCILDYGTGKLRNSLYLLRRNINVHILDSELQLSRLNKDDLRLFEKIYRIGDIINYNYDIILCSFVLNVVPEPSMREEILSTIHSLLKKNGILVLEVRREKGIMKNKNMISYNNGYAIGKGDIKTFQKPYSKLEVTQLL